MEPILGIFLAFCSYPTVVVGLRVFNRFIRLSIETERKLMHIATGICIMPLPWLIHSDWIAALLFSSFIFGPFVVDRFSWTHQVFGRVLNVQRKNVGGSMFGLGCLLLFILSHETKAIYLGSLAVLVFADALAALVGIKYPIWPYQVFGFRKTFTGSCTFFIVACICVFLPLLVFSHFDKNMLLLMSLIVSSLTTLIEALSPFGLDNLLIPLASFFLLRFFY